MPERHTQSRATEASIRDQSVNREIVHRYGDSSDQELCSNLHSREGTADPCDATLHRNARNLRPSICAIRIVVFSNCASLHSLVLMWLKLLAAFAACFKVPVAASMWLDFCGDSDCRCACRNVGQNDGICANDGIVANLYAA